jgi:integrase
LIAFVFKRGDKFSAKLRLPWEARTQVVALETTDRRAARILLDELVKERFMEQRGELTPRSMREAAERSLSDLLDSYLEDLRAKGRSETTLAKYASNIRTLTRDCRWTRVADVSARVFCMWRAKSKAAPKSLNDALANMSGFLRWLVNQRMLRENPLQGVDRVDTRLVARFRRALSEDEQTRLLAAATPFRSLVYLLVLETGARRNELNELRVGDFCLDTPSPFLRLPASITKNRREAVMRLRPHVVAAVRTVLPAEARRSDYVFRHRVPRISTIARDLRRAGIAFETEEGRIDLHALRVTFCTNLLKAGVHPRVVQELMRHSDIKLTMKNYTDASQLPLASALEKLPILALSTVERERLHNCTQICTQAGLISGQTQTQAFPAVQKSENLQCG